MRRDLRMRSSLPSRCSRSEPFAGAGRGGEEDGIHFAGRRGDDRSADGRGVGRGPPPIHREADDLRAVCGEELVQPVCARAVVLYSDASPVNALREQEFTEFGGCLGLGDPVRGEARLLYGSTRLRAPCDELSTLQRAMELIGKARLVGGFHPAAKPHARRGDHDLRRVAMSSRVCVISASSSMCGTIVSAGACRTSRRDARVRPPVRPSAGRRR